MDLNRQFAIQKHSDMKSKSLNTTLNYHFNNKMEVLDRVNIEKENVSLTLDKKVVDKLKKMREQKKLKKISPLINELLKDWLQEWEANKDLNVEKEETNS